MLFIYLIGASLIFLGFNASEENPLNFLEQQKFDYSGTNALFLETNKDLKFYWITPTDDVGTYALVSSDNKVISKGKTTKGRVHTTKIEHQINSELSFRFGGEKSALHEVRLHPKSSDQGSKFKNIDSLFIVGDVHGQYKRLINLLTNAQIIDNELNWIAGKAHLAFLGDIFDRGNQVTKVLWFIYQLEAKAEAAGGKVHLVLGNHEIMTITNDLRYISSKEASIAAVYKLKYDYLFHPKNSFLGSWISSKPSVLKIGNNLLAHGGIVDLGTNSIETYNKTVNGYIQDPMFLEINEDAPDSLKYDVQAWENMRYFFYNENSPFWYRGYVYSDTLDAQLDAMLKKYRSKTHIVGHTPFENITQKYDGKLITTDLNEKATQLLLLVKNKKKYARFKIDSQGTVSQLK